MDEFRSPQEVRPLQGLFIGDACDAGDWKKLKAMGITHICTVALGVFPQACDEFEYLQIELLDWEEADIRSHFAKGIEFIEKGREKGSVLVHCGAGISRSATMCIAYVMYKNRIPYEEARRVVGKARPWIEPNEGFVEQLKKYEDELGIASAK